MLEEGEIKKQREIEKLKQ